MSRLCRTREAPAILGPLGLWAMFLVGCTPSEQSATSNPKLEKAIRTYEGLHTRRLPNPAIVDRIEQKLSTQPCVGSLDRWFRRYAYGLDHQRGGVDGNTISFSLHEAGAYEFRAGREIVRPLEFATIDDRPYRYAWGTYNVARDTLVIETCGPNVGGP